MFDQLLLAIDESPAASVATDFAAALARRCGASVHVVYVNQRLPGRRRLTLLPIDEARDLVEAALARLEAAGIPAAGSVHVATHREVPARLAAVAGEQGAGAIVIGSRRARRWSDRMFASRVRDRVLRCTALPVVVAPTPLEVRSLQPLLLDPLAPLDEGRPSDA